MYAGAKIFNVFTMESHWIYHTAKKKTNQKQKKKVKTKTKKKKQKKTRQNKLTQKQNKWINKLKLKKQ